MPIRSNPVRNSSERVEIVIRIYPIVYTRYRRKDPGQITRPHSFIQTYGVTLLSVMAPHSNRLVLQPPAWLFSRTIPRAPETILTPGGYLLYSLERFVQELGQQLEAD